MKSKRNSTDTSGVSMEMAGVTHELLGQCFETSLRQQLLSGDFNAAMLGKVLDWLKNNNVSITEDADSSLAGVARAFRRLENDSNQSLEDILSELEPTTL